MEQNRGYIRTQDMNIKKKDSKRVRPPLDACAKRATRLPFKNTGRACAVRSQIKRRSVRSPSQNNPCDDRSRVRPLVFIPGLGIQEIQYKGEAL